MMAKWRVGEHYGIHVYEGDRPVATFHTAEDAARAVRDHNDAEKHVSLPTPRCRRADHERTGGCFECCESCNLDTHRCLGCGESLTHDRREWSGGEPGKSHGTDCVR